MNFGEMIEIVLNKMVVPEYDHIDRVVYKVYGIIKIGRAHV